MHDKSEYFLHALNNTIPSMGGNWTGSAMLYVWDSLSAEKDVNSLESVSEIKRTMGDGLCN